MVLHNPNNWHWVTKDVKPWAKEYLEKELINVSAEENGVSVQISKMSNMDGDVDVNQRKNKVSTIFDLALQLEFSGKTAEAEEVNGTISVPEVAYNTAEDEYVFEVETHEDSASKQSVKSLIKEKIIPQLRQNFQKLGPRIVEEHGKDIQHASDTPLVSGTSTPKQVSKSAAAGSSDTDSASRNSKPQTATGASVNVTTLTDQEEFRTTAEQLYKTFTDPQYIAAFTRAAPKLFEGAKKGGRFEIFDGNVKGEYTELDEPMKIVQKWRLSHWPENHHSLLRIEFFQNNQDGVTVMRVNWDGVPVGQEEVTKRNWREYYVQSIKRTFGFGTIL